MSRIIFLSNRLPKKVTRKNSNLEYEDSAGGLATGLLSLSNRTNIKWIGWPGIPTEDISKEERSTITEDFGSEDLVPIFLSEKDILDYYHGFCNSTIWPLFHYFTQNAEYHRDQWDAYKRINQKFLSALKEIYRPGDVVWVHDYHLMLLPQMIRDTWKEATVGFFLHIPFPSYEVYRLFPWREEIIDGLLGADLVGYHTYDYVTHFLKSVRRIKGYEHDLGLITCGSHICKADAYPMGIDHDRFSSSSRNGKVEEYMEDIKNKVGDRKIILSIDRLDYSKGIINRLEAFNRFLECNPEWRQKVTLILVAVPSRERVKQYGILKNNLDEKVGYVNGKLGCIGWAPVWYIYRFLPFELLLALYRSADVCMITPLRDGMNLMAKEFLATKDDGTGVLILSEMAGASHELGESLMVNPNDIDRFSETILEALLMDEKEQIERNRPMQRRIKRYDIRKWGMDFFSDLSQTRQDDHPIYSRELPVDERMKIINDYASKKNRLIILDYDGTISRFREDPKEAQPDEELMNMIKRLSDRKGTEVVIVSGRDRNTLDKWFKDENIRLCAEHGVWTRVKASQWKLLAPVKNNWKKTIRELLNVYTDRTPGSFIEEKDYSLVWHYRRTHPEMGSTRSRELVGDLIDLISNTDLGVLEGNKVIEIRNVGVNKGTAVSSILQEKKWEMVLAMGDDVTDEDMFKEIPASGYSLKIGLSPSNAKFNIRSVEEARSLLKELTEK